MTEEREHQGKQISIKGYSGVGLTGSKRHPLDTQTEIHLTLYDQDGDLQTLKVVRSRDTEMFQEWLRRYDRYTPRETADAPTTPSQGVTHDPQG